MKKIKTKELENGKLSNLIYNGELGKSDSVLFPVLESVTDFELISVCTNYNHMYNVVGADINNIRSGDTIFNIEISLDLFNAVKELVENEDGVKFAKNINRYYTSEEGIYFKFNSESGKEYILSFHRSMDYDDNFDTRDIFCILVLDIL